MKYNFKTKKAIQMLVFLIGIVIMFWQSKSTIATFLSFRTTVAISKETFDSLPIPAIVICQEHKWKNGFFTTGEHKINMSDQDWIFKQFFRLNDKMNISIEGVTLTIGNNSLGVIVKELLNPWIGLCYVMIPDPSLPPLTITDIEYIKIGFSEEIKNPLVSTYFISPEDWPGFVMPTLGLLKPFKRPWPGLETFTWVGLQRTIHKKMHETSDDFYLPASKTDCKDYSSGNESYMECMVKSNIDCFEDTAKALDSGCTCIPNILYKSYYEIYPISWEKCKINSEYHRCSSIMHDCSYNFTSKCASPCENVEYIGEFLEINGGYQFANANEVVIGFQFKTMDTKIYAEILTFDLATFIGTAGGSLGLFLGFSLTGFADKLLEFFIRN